MAIISNEPMAIVNYSALRKGIPLGEAKVDIMFTPSNIEWEADSKYATIPTFSRNNPFYHYTGGEDTITFILDWYAFDRDREEAIKRASRIKAWGRGDGYYSKPPLIVLDIGGLFLNNTYIIKAAPYTMSLFMKGGYTAGKNGQPGTANGRLMPVQITQEITLLKVTSINERHSDIELF